MFKNVFILGYPRTATSKVYDVICRVCKEKYGEKCRCFYEPFNPGVIRNVVKKGYHFHDRVGRVYSDYDKLHNELSILRLEWDKNYKQYGLGGGLQHIQDVLMILGMWTNHLHVVVKDVYVWPYMFYLMQWLPNTLFVFTVRNVVKVYESFERWLVRDYSFTYFLKKGIKKIIRNPARYVLRPLMSMKRIYEKYGQSKYTMPDNMFGLYYFYNFLYHREPVSGDKKFVLAYYVMATYPVYLEMVNQAENMYGDRVYVIRMEDKLGENDIREIASIIGNLI